MTAAQSLADRIEDLLPQTQCTKCGYNGCRPYAEAVADGTAGYNQCPPGGAQGIERLANLLGRPVIPLSVEHGHERPRPLAVIDEQLCIGCTLCMQACPVDAIVGAPKQMHTVLADLCTGCDLCVPPCPVDCIEMLPVTGTRTGWDAWSDDQAAAARARHDQHLARLARDKAAAEARAAARRAANATPTPATPAAPSAPGPAPAGTAADAVDPKRAIIAAALERARLKKAELAAQGLVPQNTAEVSPAVQAQIDAAEARRKRLAEQAAQAEADARAAGPDAPSDDAGTPPSAPPRST